jgi:drug/metabolite transporter (DMT)-like permease
VTRSHPFVSPIIVQQPFNNRSTSHRPPRRDIFARVAGGFYFAEERIMNESLSGKAAVAMTLAAACWGLGTVMSKGVLDYLPPLLLLVVQLVGSLLFLWTAVFTRRRRQEIDRRAWRLVQIII